MEYTVYAIKTATEYHEYHYLTDLIESNKSTMVPYVSSLIEDRAPQIAALALNSGDVTKYIQDNTFFQILEDLGQPENRLVRSFTKDEVTIYGIPEGPMPGDCEICKQCAHRTDGGCNKISVIDVDGPRTADCPCFEVTDVTGFYLNYDDEDEKIYLGIKIDEVLEKLDSYESEALEACKAWLYETYDKDELVDMIAEGEAPSNPVEDMIYNMLSNYDMNGFKYEFSRTSTMEFGPISFVLKEDRAGIDLTCPRSQLNYDCRKICEEEGIPQEEWLSYREIVYSEQMWLHPEIVNKAINRSEMYKGWLEVYNKLQPEVAKTIIGQ